VTDLQGRIVAFYPSQPEIIGEDFSFRDWFIGALRTNKPYVSQGYRTATNGHPMVVGVAAPVFQESRRVGVVTVLWRLDSVRELSQGARAEDRRHHLRDRPGGTATDRHTQRRRPWGAPRGPALADDPRGAGRTPRRHHR